VSQTSFILFPHGPTWQIATVTGGHAAFADMLPPEGETSAQDVARRLAEELRRLGYTGQGVQLALDSADCLAASIDTAGLPRGDRKAMLYRLEEKLPVAAEAVVADFAQRGSHALGVCVREDAAAPLLHSLESFGVAVQSISPAALLAAQRLAEDGGPQVLLIGEPDGQNVNVISLRDGVPTGWSLIPARAEDLALHLDVLAMEAGEEDVPVRACGVDAAALGGVAAQAIPAPPRQVAAIAGAAALEGRAVPWIELRRGALGISDSLRLHRKPLDAVLAAAAILLVCLAGAFLYRGQRYHGAAAAADGEMADKFQAAFPGWSRPGNIRTVVESEHRKLASQGPAALPAESSESALQTLHAAMTKLPADVKFKMERMAFFDNSFELAGHVRSFADVDTLASATRQTGYDVQPPEAHRDGEGFWSFTIRGARRGSATPPVARGNQQ
jgi:type II secretory pathway component PulL